jgi:hypothetical protein
MAKALSTDVVYKKVSPDDLHFDPSNPRFITPGGGTPTEQKIQGILEKEPHIALELVDSFLENGYIAYEPLVVRKRDSGGGYLVVEGNRRLAAIRHIRSQAEKYGKRSNKLDELNQIPVLIFPELDDQDDQRQQRVYLGVRHLFGFRDWPAESKARFLDAQIKSAEDLMRTMRELNIKKQEIQRYLVPLRLRKFAKEAWEPHKDQDFWYLGEGLNRSGIKDYISLNVDKDTLSVKAVDKSKLERLFKFIYGSPDKARKDRVIDDTRQLSQLGKVLASAQASAALEKGRTLEEASVLIESADETVKRLKRLVSELRVVMGVLKKRSSSSTLVARFESFDKASKQFASHAQKSDL